MKNTPNQHYSKARTKDTIQTPIFTTQTLCVHLLTSPPATPPHVPSVPVMPKYQRMSQSHSSPKLSQPSSSRLNPTHYLRISTGTTYSRKPSLLSLYCHLHASQSRFSLLQPSFQQFSLLLKLGAGEHHKSNIFFFLPITSKCDRFTDYSDSTSQSKHSQIR